METNPDPLTPIEMCTSVVRFLPKFVPEDGDRV